MKLFLHARHWQIVVILIVLPVAFEIVILKYFFPVDNDHKLMLYFAMMMIIYSIVFFSWLWTLGTNLFKLLPERNRMKIRIFRMLLIIPFVYILTITLLLQYTYKLEDYPVLIPAVIFPVHIFIMFSLFFCFWFVSKCLNLVEMKKAITFKHYIGDFFLIWFFPLGIWIIQPRINNIFAKA